MIKAIDYLININNGYRVNPGKKVLVIGGGFVACDAARMALHGGPEEERADIHSAVDAARVAMRAAEVHIASLESFAEMPVLRTSQGHEEFEEAQREGIVFHPQRGPQRFLGDNGRVKAVEFIGVKRTYDENGRFNPQYDSGDTEIFFPLKKFPRDNLPARKISSNSSAKRRRPSTCSAAPASPKSNEVTTKRKRAAKPSAA